MRYLIILFCCLLPALVWSQEKRDCKKSFILKGIRADGSEKEVTITVTKRFYDFDAKALKTQNDDDKGRYEGYNYIKIAEPTLKQDCAGYVFDKLWYTGKYWMTGPTFYESIIKNFGTQISNSISWGGVKAGDIVTYIDAAGTANHITIVKSVSTTLGVTSGITIETKDGKEGVFKHTLPNLTSLSNDPLVRSWGTPTVFRLNASNIAIRSVNSGDCDIDYSTLKGAYVLKMAEPNISNQYFKISESSYNYETEKGGYIFNLLNKPPAAIKPGGTFSLDISATSSEKNPLFDTYTVITWTNDKAERFPDLSDKNITIGKSEGKIIPAASGSVKMKVPEYSGKELILKVRIGSGSGGSHHDWIKFVYEKNN